jgi:hypothetical protein
LEPVKRRVAELLEPERRVAAGEVASRAWIVCNLVEFVRTGPRPDTRDLSNANRALKVLARMGGFMVDRKESYSAVDPRLLDMHQLTEALRAQMALLPSNDRETLRVERPRNTL